METKMNFKVRNASRAFSNWRHVCDVLIAENSSQLFVTPLVDVGAIDSATALRSFGSRQRAILTHTPAEHILFSGDGTNEERTFSGTFTARSRQHRISPPTSQVFPIDIWPKGLARHLAFGLAIQSDGN